MATIQYRTFQGLVLTAEVGKIYPVELSLEAEFGVHKNIEGHGPGWTVTHMASGMAFARGKTKADAIAAADAVCKNHNPGELREILRRFEQ